MLNPTQLQKTYFPTNICECNVFYYEATVSKQLNLFMNIFNFWPSTLFWLIYIDYHPSNTTYILFKINYENIPPLFNPRWNYFIPKRLISLIPNDKVHIKILISSTRSTK